MHVNRTMDPAPPDKLLKYTCAITQTSSAMWRYRMRSCAQPAWWSRQEEKEMSWLVLSQACGQEETQRNLQRSHSPSLTSTPKKTRSRDYSHQRQSHAKPSSELASLRLSPWPPRQVPHSLSYATSVLSVHFSSTDRTVWWPWSSLPTSAPSNITSTLKTESYTCAPVFLSGTWWTHKNSYWNELG